MDSSARGNFEIYQHLRVFIPRTHGYALRPGSFSKSPGPTALLKGKTLIELSWWSPELDTPAYASISLVTVTSMGLF